MSYRNADRVPLVAPEGTRVELDDGRPTLILRDGKRLEEGVELEVNGSLQSSSTSAGAGRAVASACGRHYQTWFTVYSWQGA